ncbi:ParM/StbA family protein [Orenia marismortui]|uniref:Plasmid segregation protein ParM n=1 Tax=Orenia marismortui TaxID=46469 RepID=A0A4R8GQA9_9FIRM|nr:ParM/StbA family protein [Orenia marismortui]TDX43797.1 plasmid segregation protein ParM [Orenia marismortui]
MRTEKVRVIGVDLGYDTIKMMSKGKKIMFPSLADEEEEGILLEKSLEVLRTSDNLLTNFDPSKIIIKIQDKAITGYNDQNFKAYRVGDYVLNQRSSSIAYSLSDKKYEEPEEFAKLLSGICLLFPKADKIIIKNLVTGLPIKYYEKHKESFKNKLESDFNVKIKNTRNQFVSKTIEVRKATIIPQGLASYYDFIMNDEGLVTKNIEGGFGIVDLGGLTIDCVAFNDGELIKESPISFSDGVRTRIFKKIQDSLDIDISQDLIKRQILANKDYIKVRNERYQFKKIKESTIDKLARDIALQLKNRWESYLMIDKILITGGATVLLFESINNYLPDFPCEKINNNPQFSNCRGYVKLGKALIRKREEELKSKLKERKLKALEEVAATKEG